MSKSDIRAGRAFIELFVSDRELVRGLLRARRKTADFAKMISRIGIGFAKAGSAIVGPILGAVASFAKTGDSLHKMAERTGVATTALSELGFAAEQSGGSIGDVENGIRRMQKTIGDANAGIGESTDALAGLGLSAEQLMGLSPDQQFELIAESLSKIQDPTLRAAAAMDVFGRSGTQLLPLVAGGAEGIAKMREEARQLGLSITPEQAQAAADLTDNWNRVKRSVTGTVFAIGSQLADSISRVLTVTTSVVQRVTAWVQQNKALTQGLAIAGAILTGIGTAVIGVGGAFAAASAIFGGLASAITVVSGLAAGVASYEAIIAAVGAAVAAVAVLFWKLADPIRALMPLFSAVGNAAKSIFGPLLQGDFAGAFDAMLASIGPIIRGYTRAWIDIVRNTLTNLVGLITGTSDGMSGAFSSFGIAARRIFNEVWEAGKLAFTALLSFIGDVFNQAPQIIGFAFGTAVRKIAENVLKLNQWMFEAFSGFVSTLFKSFANLGPSLIKAMLTGDVSAIADHFGSALRKSMAAQTLALSGLAAGLFGGETPEFKIGADTKAAYEALATAAAPVESAAKLPEPAKGAAPEPVTAPKLDPTAIAAYNSHLVELKRSFDAGQISAEEFAARIAGIQQATFGADATPLDAYQAKLEELNEALAAGKITEAQRNVAVKVAFSSEAFKPRIATPQIPTPVVPTPEAVQAPQISQPQVPTPQVPAPQVPTPQVQQPKVPTPEIPTATTLPEVRTPTIEPPAIKQYEARLEELTAAFATSNISAEEYATGLANLKSTTLGIEQPIEQYRDRLALLNQAFTDGTITAEEYASGLTDLKATTLGIDSPIDAYKARLALLNQALADGTITQRQWKSAVADARDEIFGLAQSPLDAFRSRVVELQQAFASGAITAAEYGKQLAGVREEVLGIPTSGVDQFAARVQELREALAIGAIDAQQFGEAFRQSQQQMLGINEDPITKFKDRLADLREALGKGLITKEQFKTEAMDALPSRVKSIIDETRTPMEKYQRDIAELNKLQAAGLIDPETHKRKATQLRETRDQAFTTGKPTTFGSFSASALVDSGRGGGANRMSERMHELSKQQSKLTADQLAELKELRKAFTQLANGMRSR